MDHRNYGRSTLSATSAALHVAIAGALAAIVVLHFKLSDIDFLLHNATVPILILPVAYFAAAYGLRGAAAAILLSTLVLLDDPSEGRPLHTLIEVVQLASVGAIGGALGALVTREHRELEALRIRELDRQKRLRRGPGYWDEVAATRMGLYVTGAESAFLMESLGTNGKGIVLDLGSGTGRLGPALLEQSRCVVATEVDGEAIRSMEELGNLQPLLVAPGIRSLPFADTSLDWVVCIEVPGVSDEDWFRAECARVLKGNGGVIITVHNAHSYKGYWTRVLARRGPRRGEHRSDVYYRHSLGWHLRRWKGAGFEVEASSGLYWLPFSRQSESRFVPPFAALERLCRLRRAVSVSPWALLRLRLTPR